MGCTQIGPGFGFASPQDKEPLYYIANGYVGNAIAWWGIDRKGYTTDITRAGKYTRAEAMEICKRPEDVAWPVDYIDKNEAAKKLIVDMQYLDSKQRRTWRKKANRAR